MVSAKFESVPNEHVFAVAFKPMARVLDLRGTWTDLFSKKLDLPRWTVGQNRLDVFSEKGDRRVFLGFREYGVQVRSTGTRNFFPEFAGRFLKCLTELQEFDEPLTLSRLGVRSRFCTPVAKSFAALSNLVQERYVSLHHDALKAIGESTKVVDVGAPFNFEDKLGLFNTHCGPMKKAQLATYFDFATADELPECGLYYDIDYHVQPKESQKLAAVADLVSAFAVEAWDKHVRVRNLILGSV